MTAECPSLRNRFGEWIDSAIPSQAKYCDCQSLILKITKRANAVAQQVSLHLSYTTKFAIGIHHWIRYGSQILPVWNVKQGITLP